MSVALAPVLLHFQAIGKGLFQQRYFRDHFLPSAAAGVVPDLPHLPQAVRWHDDDSRFLLLLPDLDPNCGLRG
jgi:hypothetical protein